MVAFRFGKLAYLLDECQSLTEIPESEGPFDALSVIQKGPFGCLCEEALCLLPREGRNAPAAGNTGLFQERFGHGFLLLIT
jgi:hypothetical protein